jgi:hypothetical protein
VNERLHKTTALNSSKELKKINKSIKAGRLFWMKRNSKAYQPNVICKTD